jgi:UDP-glucose 4-epimerase
MKYLLLGGAGFIGAHLAKRLIKDGHDVTIVDSLITSSAPNFPVKFIHADIRNAVLDELLLETDVVYFLAGSVGVANIVNNPTTTLRNNIELMNRLIPLFEKYQNKVVFSSTSEVYGDGPFSEDNTLHIGPPTDLRWGYAAAKLTTEFMISASTFPYTIVRFFNVTGPGQLGDHGMVLPRFVDAAKAGKDLTVYSDGGQVRSFCHINDAVELLLKIENINGEIFNVGSDSVVTIKALAERVIKLSNSTSKINYVPTPHSDIVSRIPDLTKVKYLTGFVAQYDLDDIIKDML